MFSCLIQPDSNQIVGRLMQIRDYIKQASTTMEKLSRSPNPVSHSFHTVIYVYAGCSYYIRSIVCGTFVKVMITTSLNSYLYNAMIVHSVKC